MKQILSIFLLMLTLVVAIQPTLAMHFCGGSLQSIEILKEQKNTGCCPTMEHQKQAEHTSTHILPKSCCLSQEVHLSTDDYQYQNQNSLPMRVLYPIDFVWFASSFSFKSVDLALVSVSGFVDPPEGFANQNVDILTSISILII